MRVKVTNIVLASLVLISASFIGANNAKSSSLDNVLSWLDDESLMANDYDIEGRLCVSPRLSNNNNPPDKSALVANNATIYYQYNEIPSPVFLRDVPSCSPAAYALTRNHVHETAISQVSVTPTNRQHPNLEPLPCRVSTIPTQQVSSQGLQTYQSPILGKRKRGGEITPEQRAETNKKKRESRDNETKEHRDDRLKKRRERYQQSRANETKEHRDDRLKKRRERDRQSCANETKEHRVETNKKIRESRANMTPEQKKALREKERGFKNGKKAKKAEERKKQLREEKSNMINNMSIKERQEHFESEARERKAALATAYEALGYIYDKTD